MLRADRPEGRRIESLSPGEAAAIFTGSMQPVVYIGKVANVTLILGTVANGGTPHVVISADGISIATRGDQQYVCSGTTQKVWHFRQAKAIVAHFGLNKLWDDGTSSWVGIANELGAMSEADSLPGFGTSSHCLVETFGDRITAALKRADSARRFALWIARIEDSGLASIEEICWERSDSGDVSPPQSKRFGQKGKGEIAAGGDGLDIVRPLLSERIDGQYYPEQLVQRDVDFALEYHRRFLIAGLLEQSRQGKMVFGGKCLTVAISKDGGKSVTFDL